MTFYEINEAIKSEMQLDPGLNTDAERIRYINTCLDKIGGLQLLEKVSTITTSAQYPTMPTGWGRIVTMYWNGVPLKNLSADITPDTYTGVPTGYIIEADLVRLYPAPQGSGSLKTIYTYTAAYAALTDLVSTSVVSPDLPIEFHSAIVDYGVARSHRKNGNLVMENRYKGDFEINMANLVRVRLSRRNASVISSTTDIYKEVE